MDPKLLTKVINYHGQELMRVLHEEQGPDNLAVVDLREINYLEYHKRASEFGFQHRIRRQKLYQFIARKADKLFKPLQPVEIPVTSENENEELYAIMPPLESFMRIPCQERKWSFYQNLKKGDIVVGKIVLKGFKGCQLHLLCFDGGKKREIHDLGIKAFCPQKLMAVAQTDDSYEVEDILRGVVIGCSPGTQKIIVSAIPAYHLNYIKMGLIGDENLPLHYRQSKLIKSQSFSEMLEHTLSFNNPTCTRNLCLSLGLSSLDLLSITEGLHNVKYPKEEYSSGLRRLQSSKWAYKSVRDGVLHFKAGNYTEAFQSLNKALQIDPENVEALVARGALFANKNNLHRAVEDFETALTINRNHSNAQKYISETLVALGKDYEENNDFEAASKTYKRALEFNMNNVDAKNALSTLEAKRQSSNEAQVQSLPASSTSQNSTNVEYSQELIVARNKLKQLLKQEIKERLMKRKHSSSSPSKSHMHSSSPHYDQDTDTTVEKYIHEDTISHEDTSPVHKKMNKLGVMEVHPVSEEAACNYKTENIIQKHTIVDKSSKESLPTERIQDSSYPHHDKELSTRSQTFSEPERHFNELDVELKQSGTAKKKSPKVFFVWRKEQDIRSTVEGGLKKEKDKAISFFFSGDSDSNDDASEDTHKKIEDVNTNSTLFEHNPHCSMTDSHEIIRSLSGSEEFNHDKQLQKSDIMQHKPYKLKNRTMDDFEEEISKKHERQTRYHLPDTYTSEPSQSNKYKRDRQKSKEYTHHPYYHKQNRKYSPIASSSYPSTSQKYPLPKSPKPFHGINSSASYNKGFEYDKRGSESLKIVQPTQGSSSDYSTKHSLQYPRYNIHSEPAVPQKLGYDGAVAAAKKINEQLQWSMQNVPACSSNVNKPEKDSTFNSNDALQQMESFLQKLRDTKKAKSLASNKQ